MQLPASPDVSSRVSLRQRPNRGNRLPAGWLAGAVATLLVAAVVATSSKVATAGDDRPASEDRIRQLQTGAVTQARADWGYWGTDPNRFSTWNNHSNRLIPVYTFGITLDALRQQGSPYATEEGVRRLYGVLPENTVNPRADYLDQTNIYDLQQQAVREGKRHIILLVFDGMDWQTTHAAAIHASGRVAYTEGRGTGLSFQDYEGATTDYGFIVTSPHRAGADGDVDAQLIPDPTAAATGGYDPQLGGAAPWAMPSSRDYLIGMDRTRPHTVTDSASSGTSMTAGVKTYNAAINVGPDGSQVEPIAHGLQRDRDFAIGLVSSVPASHATPASGYAHNVSRNDYQDISRDLLGLPSIAHRTEPLPGADVILAAGWGEITHRDAAQGQNFVPGNKYVTGDDIRAAAVEGGGRYVIAERTEGREGRDVLAEGVEKAIAGSHRLFGLFGADGGNLPFRTADGGYDPTIDITGTKEYSEADVRENPTLAELTSAALEVLEKDEQGFWLLVEAGDVDWANHANNIDNSIGAVISGAEAFDAITRWVEAHDAWDSTAIIVTADHGHYFHLTRPEALIGGAAER